MVEVTFGGELVEDIPDDKLIAVGRAAIRWHAENGKLTHDPTCPHSTKNRAHSLGLACNCGVIELESALDAIWE